ncbi:MAG: hypothetical protein K0R54_1856 [Clostridiaceae bacterium]|jgi:DNA repair photolyase|nr:hypothetical protein [Clostridiaceae bacterium]
MKIGITEAGDASLDYTWVEKMNSIDGAIIITKNITDKFIEEILKYKDKVILHATCTGYGGTIVEPNIPDFKKQLYQVKRLINSGFPSQNIVIRIDPIIPTKKGLENVKNVIDYISNDVKRFRISVIDMYPHVRERFKTAGIPVPFTGDFQAMKSEFNEVNRLIKEMKDSRNLVFESCSETYLTEASQTGCVSKKDLDLLNLKTDNDTLKGQRRTCLCLASKTELLTYSTHKNGYGCQYQCLYCYWK